jgi:hypothetical protein
MGRFDALTNLEKPESEISHTITAQLKKFGYNIETLDQLFSALPEVICTKIGKSIKRTPIVFLLGIDNGIYTLSSVIKNGEDDPDVLQKTSGRNLTDVLGKTIIWLEKSGLLDVNATVY